MKKILIALLCLAALGLTACEHVPTEEENVRTGKLCADDGGSWTWNSWGYHCEFKAKS